MTTTDLPIEEEPGSEPIDLGINSTRNGHDPAARAVVTTNEGQAHEIIGAMADALEGWNVPPSLFRRAGKLTRIGRSELGVGEAQAVESEDYLNIFSAAADYRRFDSQAQAYRAAHPTKEFRAAAIARALSEERLPALRAVTSTPIIHEDGRIIDREGYDSVTRSYFAPREGFRFGHVPAKPTREQAEAAIGTLLAPFEEIAFASETDRANFLAVILTTMARGWFPTVPLVVLEAPIQGSGKTLVAQSIRMLVEGTAGVGSAPESGRDHEAEWRKRITSALLGAPSIVIFDNITGTLGGAALSALATSPTWEDRILSTNDIVEVYNSATWLFTSNNAALDADLIRRTLFVRLDPRDAAPHLRTGFRIPDLLGHVEQHRGELLAAACTVVRHWITAGRPPAPDSTPTLGSFEKWSRTVPAILAAAGVDGVLGDLDERARLLRDPADLETGEFLAAWHSAVRLRERTTARALAEEGKAGRLDLPSVVTHDRELAGSLGGVVRSLGKWLQFRRDRIVEGPDGEQYAVRGAGGSAKSALLWRVERIG